jgi:hypothetical protein
MNRANLNESYFTYRQDRYAWINNAAVASYFYELAATVGKLSFEVVGGKPMLKEPLSSLWRDKKSLRKYSQEVIQSFLEKQLENTAVFTSKSDTFVFPTVQFGMYNIR